LNLQRPSLTTEGDYSLDERLFFVTIAHTGEIGNLILQARSLRRFGGGLIKHWLIVWNEPDQKLESHATHFQLVRNELSGADFDYEIMPRSKILDFDDPPGSGHGMQQVLKLNVARVVSSPVYILLDAKNHAVRELAMSDFFHEGKVRIFRQNYKESDNFYQKFVMARQIFKAPRTEGIIKALPSTTPYPMVTSAVLEMLDELPRVDGDQWRNRILERRTDGTIVTEFSLYNGFLESRGLVDSLYHFNDDRVTYALFKVSPTSEGECQALISRVMSDEKVKFFGIHQARYSKLSEMSKAMISVLWINTQLMSTVTDALRMLERQEL
jgi:hypothetical protein